jgi:hypothetical protein
MSEHDPRRTDGAVAERSVDSHEDLPSSARSALRSWAESLQQSDDALVAAVMDEVIAIGRVQAWADAMVPPLPEGFAQSVVDRAVEAEAALDARRSDAMRAWADAMVPPLPEGFAQSVVERAMAAEPAKGVSKRESSDASRASGVVEKFVPASARRRWLAPAAVSSFAAAAATILALTSGSRTQPPSHEHERPAHGSAQHTMQVDPGAMRANTNSTSATSSSVLVEAESGSEVEKVEVDGDRASFTAFSLDGEGQQGSIAVVWIDDGVKPSSGQ